MEALGIFTRFLPLLIVVYVAYKVIRSCMAKPYKTKKYLEDQAKAKSTDTGDSD